MAAISKAAKEKKMRERIIAEQNMDKDVLKENGNNTTFLLVLGAALVVTAGGYYAYRNKSPKVEESQQQPKGMVNHFD